MIVPENRYVSYLVGVLFMVLSKIKYILKDYTPRDGSTDGDGYSYSEAVVSEWIERAKTVSPEFSVSGRHVLELGPGSDLGTGIILLALGAESYTAYDIHDLAKRTTVEYYKGLINALTNMNYGIPAHIENNLEELIGENSEKLKFVKSKHFDFTEFADDSFDLIVSQAAFEHFGNPKKTIQEISKKCKSGARFIAVIDIATHSRWLRQKDPLNIYRIHDFIYRLLAQPATPNRVRPEDYRATLAACGWTDIHIDSRKTASVDYVDKVRDSIRPRFRDDHLRDLSIFIAATKA